MKTLTPKTSSGPPISDDQPIPADVMQEAQELARAAEVLPGGVCALADRILKSRAENRPLRVKLGVDPTSSQLHLGHTVVLRRLQRFQSFGHQAVLIIGGFTAMIGDPTGRNSTRPALTAEQVQGNARTFVEQVSHILDPALTEVVNNADWLDMQLSKLVPMMSKVSVSQIMSRFQERLADNQPFVFLELFYPLLQGIDSVVVRADVEIGGTDQRSNLFMGRDLQSMSGQSQQLVLMLPILEGIDGVRKMSKSFDNSIALNDAADDIFGKCMSIPDALIIKFLELATAAGAEDIDREVSFMAQGGNPRDAKERLATRIVSELRGAVASAAALDTWRTVHTERRLPADMPTHALSDPWELRSLLVAVEFVTSLTKAAQCVNSGAVKLDGVKLSDPRFLVQIAPGESKVLSFGRRRFLRLVNPEGNP